MGNKRMCQIIQIQTDLIHYMSSSETNHKAKSQPHTSVYTFPATDPLSCIETPIRRSPPSHTNFSLPLSPLPFPLKADMTLIGPSNQTNHSATELMVVQTPVGHQPHRFMGLQEADDICNEIVNKIIFESSEEEANNSSSCIEGEFSSFEEMSLREELEEPDDNFSGVSQMKQNQLEPANGSTGEAEREIKGKRGSANRAGSSAKEVNSPKKVTCNCKKTKCLKLYCDCFRLNRTCDGCNCVDCHNSQSFSGERNNAIVVLMDRNPDPFGQKIEADRHVKGCNCKKSNCSKRYCECYQAGLKCGDNCKCEDCKNTACGERCFEERGGASFRLTAKKEKRMVEL